MSEETVHLLEPGGRSWMPVCGEGTGKPRTEYRPEVTCRQCLRWQPGHAVYDPAVYDPDCRCRNCRKRRRTLAKT